MDELVRRLADDVQPATVSLARLPLSAREAVADLLGLDRVPDVGRRVRLDRLLAALRLDDVAELREAVEALRGPLPQPRSERRSATEARDQLWAWLTVEATRLAFWGAAGSGADAWVEGQQRRGVRGGLARHRQRLCHALEVLRRLPAEGVPLAVLAAEVVGDPHALDRHRSLEAVVLDAVALALGRPRPVDAEGIRLLWEAVGVAPDPLSSTVLCLGLPGDGHDGPVDRWLVAAAADSEPLVLTLSQLRRWPRPPLDASRCAFVVENPSLLASAAASGWRGPPLVCSSGRPTVAVSTLLRQLGAAGAPVYQHADFDAVGLAITGWLRDRAGTIPWHMDATDYQAALESRPDSDRRRRPLVGPLPPTPWDPGLRAAMEAASLAVYEEEVVHALLAEAALKA